MPVDLGQLISDRLREASDTGKGLPFPEFAKKRLKIRTKEGSIIPFRLKAVQREYYREKQKAISEGKPRKFLLLKYRRGGFTTFEQAQSYHLAVTQRRAWVATLAHTKESTDKISMIAKLFKEEDPHLPSKDEDHTVSLNFRHTKSKFFLGTAGGKAFGRGDTLNRTHGSEVAWWCPGPQQIDQVSQIMAGITEATSHGEVVCETTPNGIEWFAMTFKEASTGINDWTPIFLPWYVDEENSLLPDEFSEEELFDTISEEEKDVIRRFQLAPAQLAWRRTKIKALGRLFKQEYPEDSDTCFLSSGTPFFDIDIVSVLLENLDSRIKKYPDYKVAKIPGGEITKIEEPDPNKQYVAGCDTSEGLAKSDPCGVGIMDKETGEQVAWVYGRFRPEALAKHAYDLCKEYNDALLAVERQNHGHSVLNTLDNILQYPRLFYCKNEKGQPGPGKSGKLGWDTNSETRPIMLDDLEELVRSETNIHKWRHRAFLSQCLTFKLQSNGKYEADPGCHDDAVMMWAIANQVRKYSRHRARIIVLG